jgi:hypothetical protein
MKKAEFIDYVLSFYAPGQIYGDFFENSLTQEEVNRAVRKPMRFLLMGIPLTEKLLETLFLPFVENLTSNMMSESF